MSVWAAQCNQCNWIGPLSKAIWAKGADNCLWRCPECHAELLQFETYAGDGWCIQVMAQIQAGKLAEAGYQLAQLVNFALKTQHDEQFNREVRNCVLAFWQRCDSER